MGHIEIFSSMSKRVPSFIFGIGSSLIFYRVLIVFLVWFLAENLLQIVAPNQDVFSVPYIVSPAVSLNS